MVATVTVVAEEQLVLSGRGKEEAKAGHAGYPPPLKATPRVSIPPHPEYKSYGSIRDGGEEAGKGSGHWDQHWECPSGDWDLLGWEKEQCQGGKGEEETPEAPGCTHVILRCPTDITAFAFNALPAVGLHGSHHDRGELQAGRVACGGDKTEKE